MTRVACHISVMQERRAEHRGPTPTLKTRVCAPRDGGGRMWDRSHMHKDAHSMRMSGLGEQPPSRAVINVQDAQWCARLIQVNACHC